MSGSISLLHLPVEIRLRIYEAHFSSTIVRACTTLELPSSTSSGNSLALVCKRVREESLPHLYKYALFWVDSIAALIHLVNHQTAAQLQSIRHFAIRNSLVPLPLAKSSRAGTGQASTPPTTLQMLHQAFYQQICSDLRTLVIFNTINAGTRRRILEEQAGRTFTDDEFENHCFDGMCLKAQLFLPVLKEQGIVLGPNRLASNEDHIPFRIMLRYSGTDDKVCAIKKLQMLTDMHEQHRVGVYRPKKGSQQVAARVEPDDPGIQVAFTFV
jgi:hypothetical protein